jgi:hypothetical protein
VMRLERLNDVSFPGDSEMAGPSVFDWSKTDFEPPEDSHCTFGLCVSVCLTLRFPILL